MINTIKKSFLIFAATLMASVSFGQQTTFGFESSSELSTNFTYSCDNANGSMTITTSQKHGGSSSLEAAMGGTGKKNNYLVTKNSYSNVTQIKFWLASSDKGKTELAIESCASADFSSGVNTILVLTTYSNLPGISSPSNKTFYEVTITPSSAVSGYLRFTFRQPSSSGKKMWMDDLEITASAGPVAVTGVSLNKNTLSLEAGQNETLTATVAPSNADNKNVSWSSSDANIASVDQTGKVSALSAGTATITVTTEDGSKTATCTVTVTAPAAPIEVTGISLNKNTTTIYVGSTETLTVSYTPTDANTGKAVNWTSSNTSVATVDANGTVTAVAVGTAVITATSTTSASITASCTVTVDVAHPTGVTLDKSSLNLQIGGSETLTATVAPSNASNKSVNWTSSNTSVATVNNNGQVTAVGVGTATITATTVDGNKTATCTVTVTAGPPVPSTTLSLHMPEVYEAKEIAGGYNTPLTVVNGREYEVFYINRDNNSNVTIATLNTDKAGSISDPNKLASNTTETKDGWAKIAGSNGTGGDQNATAQDEFQTSLRCVKFNSSNGHYLEMHVQGYDQFSFYGKDNNTDATKGKMFEVYIDDVKQTRTPSDYAINRFTITSGEHVIRVSAIGSSDSKLCSFSLRVAQEPRTKWLKGNDSTQVVMQTTAIKPVYYFTKHNAIGETRLVWDGPEAIGITLQSAGTGSLGDTLVLDGNANCPVGVYNYHVAAYYNGIETSRANGKFTVASDIKALTDVVVDVYQGEEMDQIAFKYYALSESDIQLTWTNGAPAGVSGSAVNGKYIIGGTPTTTNTYPFDITVTGADTVIHGQINVIELNYGQNPVLYLYKNNAAYDKDGINTYLRNKWNIINRKAKEDGLRPADQYAKYKWILISEDVDADNPEVIQIIRGGANLPVLNLKGFTYATDALDDVTRLGWGEPDNGAIDTADTKDRGCNIWIQRNDHPVFAKLSNVAHGTKVKILSSYESKGVMPVAVHVQGTLCLATGETRDLNNYYGAGPQQTAIHEVPAEMRGGKKYICLPVSRTALLTTQGERLVDGIVDYLTSPNASNVEIPEIQIMHFTVEGIDADINHAEHTIRLNISKQEYERLDSLRATAPLIQLADPIYTHVTPGSGETVDLRFMTFLSKTYTVTDYINKWSYDFSIRLYDEEGIEDVYEAGQWVNVFDIYGRKVATTNEDIYQMELPHGMYIIVTEGGNTLKIMR